MRTSARRFLIAVIALCHVYLLLHSQEPLRLNVGDPWSEANVLSSIKYAREYGFLETSFTDILDVGPLTEHSYRYTHYPPLSEIIYASINKYLGVSTIETYRLFAIIFSALAMWFLYLYSRRMWGETVGLLATVLWSGSLFWMMYADCIHQAPIFQCTTFGGLWALSRALDTRQRRYYIAAFLGMFACFLTSYDGWIFVPSAVLFTVYTRAGNPFSREHRHLIWICASGCVLAIVTKAAFVIGALGWHGFVADVHLQFLERATSTFERQFDSATPTLVRRLTMMFSPLFWLTAAYHTIKAIRARSLRSALENTSAWMLACGLGFLYLFSHLAASQLLPSQVMLPFYAIGTAQLIDRLLGGSGFKARAIGYAWLVASLLWGFYFLGTIERAFLPRQDVEAANGYLASHDHNDFLLSNLMADGPIQAYFDKHYWSAPDAVDPNGARRFMLETFDQTGKGSAHALIFKQIQSRFIDKSLWPLALPLRQWSITGAPFLWKDKTKWLIADYDRRVANALDAVGAVKVLELSTFDIYRLDKEAVLAKIAANVPLTRFIDLSGASSNANKLLGWSTVDTKLGAATTKGHASCASTMGCKTILTNRGVMLLELVKRPSAEVAIRVTEVCDLKVHLQFARPAAFRVGLNGYKYEQSAAAGTAVFTVPSSFVVPGINTLTVEDIDPWIGAFAPALWGVAVRTIEIEPCGARQTELHTSGTAEVGQGPQREVRGTLPPQPEQH